MKPKTISLFVFLLVVSPCFYSQTLVTYFYNTFFISFRTLNINLKRHTSILTLNLYYAKINNQKKHLELKDLDTILAHLLPSKSTSPWANLLLQMLRSLYKEWIILTIRRVSKDYNNIICMWNYLNCNRERQRQREIAQRFLPAPFFTTILTLLYVLNSLLLTPMTLYVFAQLANIFSVSQLQDAKWCCSLILPLSYNCSSGVDS